MGMHVLAGLSKTQLVPRVQAQVSFGQTPGALRGLIEMSPNLNVLWDTPIANFLGQVWSSLIVNMLLLAPEKCVFPMEPSVWVYFPTSPSEVEYLYVSLWTAGSHWDPSFQPGGHFFLGIACLDVPEKPGFTSSFAKSPGRDQNLPRT